MSLSGKRADGHVSVPAKRIRQSLGDFFAVPASEFRQRFRTTDFQDACRLQRAVVSASPILRDVQLVEVGQLVPENKTQGHGRCFYQMVSFAKSKAGAPPSSRSAEATTIPA